MTEDFFQDALALQTVVNERRVLVAGHGCSTKADFCLVIYLQNLHVSAYLRDASFP